VGRKRKGESVDCCTINTHFETMIWELKLPPENGSPRIGEVALWRRVVILALLDFCNTSELPKVQKTQREAEEWLRFNKSKFTAVCELADIDPVKLRRMVQIAVNNPRTVMAELKKRITRP